VGCWVDQTLNLFVIRKQYFVPSAVTIDTDYGGMAARRITLGNLTIDRSEYTVRVGERYISLTFVQFELLYILAANAGKVISRDRLLSAIWQEDSDETHKLTVHISRLRRKLRGTAPWSLETVMKRGYILRDGSLPATGPSVRKRVAMKTAGVRP